MFNKKLEQHIRSVQSMNQKAINQLRSEFDKKLNEIKKDENTLSEELLKVLWNKSGYQLYKIRNTKTGTPLTGTPFCLTYTFGIYEPLLYNDRQGFNCETISIDELQKIGKYETFKVGDGTYALAKIKKTKKNK